MRLHPIPLLVLVIAQAGCIENMEDLRETLGFEDPPPVEPVYLPPVAKAQATATSVVVGETITFGSEGSKDPQKLPLDYNWAFGDDRIAHGPHASHAFRAPGEYKVRLMVTNLAGLTDDDIVLVTVAPANLAPSAAIRIEDVGKRAAARGETGDELSFLAVASDPEGSPLTYDWDFGDGATSHDAKTSHHYADPGTYAVRLRVTDRAGLVATSEVTLPIDLAYHAGGAFEPGGKDVEPHAIVVAPGAHALTVSLRFEAGMGLNDLEIVVLDANGDEVARSSGDPAPGATEGARAIELDATALSRAPPGEWSVQILRERGLSAEWTLDVFEQA